MRRAVFLTSTAIYNVLSLYVDQNEGLVKRAAHENCVVIATIYNSCSREAFRGMHVSYTLTWDRVHKTADGSRITTHVTLLPSSKLLVSPLSTWEPFLTIFLQVLWCGPRFSEPRKRTLNAWCEYFWEGLLRSWEHSMVGYHPWVLNDWKKPVTSIGS